MSSRFPTRWLSRSASTSIVSQNPRMASGVQVTSRLSTLVAAALIEASGVRRSWETAASSAVRRRFASASPTADAASACNRIWCCVSRSWATKALSTRRAPAERSEPRSARIEPPARSATISASSDAEGGWEPAALTTDQPSSDGMSSAAASRSRVSNSSCTSSVSASVPGSTERLAKRLSASASARARDGTRLRGGPTRR